MLKWTFLCVFMQIDKWTLRCSFDILSGALSIAPTGGSSKLPKMKSQMPLQVQHFAQSYASKIAWASLTQVHPEVHLLVHPQVHLFVQILKRTFRCNSRCIIRCTLNCNIKRTSQTFIVAPFAVSCASPGKLKSSFLLSFLIGQILHPFASLSPFLRTFSSAFHIRSHL